MEVSEQVYKGGTTSKITTREESNRDGHVRKKMDEKPPCLPTPRRAALTSARQKM